MDTNMQKELIEVKEQEMKTWRSPSPFGKSLKGRNLAECLTVPSPEKQN